MNKTFMFVVPQVVTESVMSQALIEATPGSVDAAKIAKVELPKGGPRSKMVVWLVDGKLIRDSLDTEFLGGGHHFRYQWIPEGEIWLEAGLDPMDIKFFLLHELCERVLMIQGMGYEESHAHANKREGWARKHPILVDECIAKALHKNIKAERT